MNRREIIKSRARKNEIKEKKTDMEERTTKLTYFLKAKKD